MKMSIFSDLNQPAPIPQLCKKKTISKLMYLVWESRDDLQQAFDLKTTQGQENLHTWFNIHFEKEYGNLPNAYVDNNKKWYSCISRYFSSPPKIKASNQAIEGTNLIGYAHAELGLGEHVRQTAAAFTTAQSPFGIINFNKGLKHRQNDVSVNDNVINSSEYPVNLLHINPDKLLQLYFDLGEDFFTGKYNIGYWVWELAICPEPWIKLSELVDEIWASTRFVQEIFESVTSKPVIYMPQCVTLPTIPAYTKANFGIPSESFAFLYTFDFYSFIDRKNPFAAIIAFKEAFNQSKSDVCLVIKAMNADKENQHWLKMQELIADDKRIIVINETMNREEILGLFSVCDSFVSLHRSEGFGRGIAEAMYLGKPVIVTNYSGNVDFTNHNNACPVDYQLIPVEKGQYFFAENQVWAEPDTNHAAWYMSKLVNDQAYRTTIAQEGQKFILENYNPMITGKLYHNRIKEIANMQ